jgi:signal transduction histidine kinase
VLELSGLNTAMDTVLMTGAIYFTGGPLSPLLPIYVIEITVIALLTNLGVTLLIYAQVIVCFTAMTCLMSWGVLPPQPIPVDPTGTLGVRYALVAIFFASFVVGLPTLFTTLILRILRRKEVALEARTAQLIEANKERSQFLAAITHELRTPIHGVQGLSELIASGVYGPATDKQQDACASIKRSAQSLLGLVDDVLNLARAEANKIETRTSAVDVAELVERVTASVSWMVGTKKIVLETDVPPELPFVQSDGRWLAHVLVNLVSNAVKFTPEGGKIIVRAYEATDRDGVVLEVIDTGPGIAREDRERIFEPFRQGDGSDERGYGGVGLGLALVARLTDLLACHVELDSELDRGSTFRVIVPYQWRGRAVSRLMRAVSAPQGVLESGQSTQSGEPGE